MNYTHHYKITDVSILCHLRSIEGDSPISNNSAIFVPLKRSFGGGHTGAAKQIRRTNVIRRTNIFRSIILSHRFIDRLVIF